MKTFYYVIIIGLCFVKAGCKKDNHTATEPQVVADTSLQKNLPFPIGAAVNISLLKSDAKYSGLVIKEFNSLTAENAMKFAALYPAKDSFAWGDADYLVNFAQVNHKRLHGHTLVWYQSLPSWVLNFSGDSIAWENLLKTHIQTVVAHFKGKVSSWDVVNEAFNDDGTMRNSIWLQKLGSDYVARCFVYAHEADTAALLFYNDYGHEYSAVKRTAICNYLVALRNRGIPVHGIGMQFHTRYNQTDANISAAISAAVATGLKVHMSELDMAVNPDNNPSLVFTPALAEQQASKYLFIVKTYNTIPAAQRYGITTWNVTDGDSWIPGYYKRPDWPLPFDAAYARKPAYYSIIAGAK